MNQPSFKQKGAMLIEILIGLAVGLVLTFGMVIFYTNSSKVANETLSTTRLEYELQTAMKLIKDDIRRAGFSASAAALVGSGTVNPFMVNNVSDITSPTTSCILFTYDLDLDGTLPNLNTINSDERFGYRLQNQTLQTRAKTTNTFACDTGLWEDLSNSNLIRVTNLTFTLTENAEPLDPSNPSGASIIVRQVTISLTGQLIKNALVERTITSQVKDRNDKYAP